MTAPSSVVPGTVFVDDTDLSLAWEGEWKQQSEEDDTIAKVSFGGSYHATEANGSMLIFKASNGTMVTLYGSKGPGHANYTVNVLANNTAYDNSAFAQEFQPMQILWSGSFTADSSIHVVSVVVGDNTWFDLDYITIRNTTTNPSDPLGSYTSTNAAVVSSLPTSTSLSPSLPTLPASTPPSSNKTSDTTLITTVVLGTVLFLLIVGLLFRLYIKKRRIRKVSSESRKITQFANPISHTYDATASNYDNSLAGLLNGQSPATSPSPSAWNKSMQDMQLGADFNREMSVRTAQSAQTVQTLGYNREANNKSAMGWSGITITGSTRTDGVTGTGTGEWTGKDTDTWNGTGKGFGAPMEPVIESPPAFGDAGKGPGLVDSEKGADGFASSQTHAEAALRGEGSAPAEAALVTDREDSHADQNQDEDWEWKRESRSPTSPTGSELRRKSSKTSNASSFPSLYGREPMRPPPMPPVPIPPVPFELRDVRGLERLGLGRLPPSAFEKMKGWKRRSRDGEGSEEGLIRMGSVKPAQKASVGIVQVQTPVSAATFSQSGSGSGDGTGDGDSQRSNFLRI